MNRGERRAGHLSRAQQMIHIRARIVAARVAVAAVLNRREIELKSGALNIPAAVLRKHSAVTRGASWSHTIKSIATVLDRKSVV